MDVAPELTGVSLGRLLKVVRESCALLHGTRIESRRATFLNPKPQTLSRLSPSSLSQHCRLHQLLRSLDTSFDSSPASHTISNEQQMEYVEKRLASALSEISRGPHDSLEHHLFITVARALVPPAPSRPSLAPAPPASPSPSHSIRNIGGGCSGGGGGGADNGVDNGETPDSEYRRNEVAKQEVERLQRKMEQLQEELEKARREAERAAAEAEQARAVKHSWVQEREREVADGEKKVKELERQLAQERHDCAHYKGSYEQLQRSKDELEEHVQQVEKARKYHYYLWLSIFIYLFIISLLFFV